MSSRFKITLALAFAIVLFNATISFLHTNRLLYNERLVSHSNEVLFELERVLSLVKDAETGMRGYVLTGQKPYLEPYFTATKRLEKQLEPLNTLVRDNPVQKRRVPPLENEIRTRLALAKRAIVIRDTQGLQPAIAFISKGEGKREMDEIRRSLDTMRKEEIHLRDVRNVESNRSAQTARLTFWLATLSNLALLGGVGALLVRAQKQNEMMAIQKAETERQKQELDVAYGKLQRAEEMRDSLTAMLVHDLRTPLTTIIGPLEMLKDGMLGELDETQNEIVSMSLGSGQRLLQLVNELLDISKMEAGQLQIRADSLKVDEPIRKAVDTVSLSQYGGGAKIVIEIAPDMPLLKADEELVTRVLINLLGNALKFTPVSGTITVGARMDDSEPHRARLFVRDTGEGIPAADVEKVFDKFGQVESRKAGRKMSTGLGLTFCKLAVEAHRGRIWVESELGKGSTFFFTLPLR